MAPIIVKSLSPEEREALRLRGIAEREEREVADEGRRREKQRIYDKRYCAKHRGAYLERKRRYFASNKAKSLSAYRQRMYGISQNEWDELFKAQGKRCANLECGAVEPGGRGHWHTDHCHTTGEIRGILCQRCNQGIGLFSDNPARLRAAADYLEKHVARRLECSDADELLGVGAGDVFTQT